VSHHLQEKMIVSPDALPIQLASTSVFGQPEAQIGVVSTVRVLF
jgi:hypothetical protein